ncbi:MAG TPA: hypothetical protein VFS41_00400 [Edaphobacter sp.]|nr:hypothetical protein [Edaphobacter sp.]
MGRLAVVLFWASILFCTTAALAKPPADRDSDRDGLADGLENTLLEQFQPTWMISRQDCSDEPAQFRPDVTIPNPVADDGTIYGQASPHRGMKDEVELHYYHLWRLDCGEMGHALDAEHVSVLVRRVERNDAASRWTALYWYAAAHEDTVCDASQMSRASTLQAEEHGAMVWISPGKHASFLNQELCSHGCGGDRCTAMTEMKRSEVVNLGEPRHPANGARWATSSLWPLAEKMRRTDFTASRLSRMERLPDTDIAWANPAKRPAQAAIYGGNSALNGIATGGRSTDTALVLANDSTGRALGRAQDRTGDALKKSWHSVVHAVGGAVKATGHAIEGKGADEAARTPR